MKRIKSITAILLVLLLVFAALPLPVFAATEENSIESYENILSELAIKYNLQDDICFVIEETPQDSLSNFRNRMDKQFRFLSENIVEIPKDAILLEKNESTSFDTVKLYSPLVTVASANTIYSEFKNSAVYFRIWCRYEVGTVNGVKKVVAVHDILGSTSFAGALLSFTFEQKSTSYRFLSDGTVEAFAIGDWIDNKNGVRVVYLPGHAIQGIFGAKHI